MIETPSATLLLEVDLDEARRIGAALDGAGLAWARADSLHGALRLLAAGRFGALLLDLTLPDVDALGRLRAEAPDVAIVALGDLDDETLAEEVLVAGADDYLYKGAVEPGLLRRVLRHAYTRRGLASRLRRARQHELLGRLVEGVAHDFNNQMTAVLGFSELTTWDLEPDHPARSHLDVVRRAAERSSSLANLLLTFGRRDGFRSAVVDCREIVGGVVRLLERLLREGTTLEARLGVAGLPVRVDPVQMQQAVLQLALGATGETLAFEVRRTETHPLPADGPGAVIEVTGAAPAADGLVEDLVAFNGGEVELVLEPGVAERTRIYLPVVDEVPLAPARLAGAQPGEAVLVVEDDEAVRELIRCVLEECGYRVLVARDAEEALALVGRADLLLADIVLPGRSGVELAAEAAARRKDLRVIYMTGYGAGAKVPPGARVLPKPLSPAHIAQEVRASLDL